MVAMWLVNGFVCLCAVLQPSVGFKAPEAIRPVENVVEYQREYKLPELPYAYDALEPHIDEATLRVHHLGHHAAYTKKLNTALGQWRKSVRFSQARKVTASKCLLCSSQALDSRYSGFSFSDLSTDNTQADNP